MTALLEQRLKNIPFLVVDVETTGLVPGKDRIVELAAVLVAPGRRPRVVLDTLIDPGSPVRATEIHGLSDEDVEGAPFVSKVGLALRPLLANRVLAGHNFDFDLRFLFGEQILPRPMPYVCTLELAQELYGHRLSLERLCQRLGISFKDGHSARADALATAQALVKMIGSGDPPPWSTLEDLAETSRRFASSLDKQPLRAPASLVTPEQIGAKPRSQAQPKGSSSAARQYLDAMIVALADLEIEDHELRYLHNLRADLVLPPSQQRAVHARVFMAFLDRYGEDKRIDPTECAHLQRVYACLHQLGWAPGDPGT